jgi:DNA-binding PadR family transcriptional regulator
MDNRLKNLQKSMNVDQFKGLKFTKQMKDSIFEKIESEEPSDEEVFLTILQLLLSERTGFTVSRGLRSKRVSTFEGREGYLYTLLHRMEQKNFISARWNAEEQKVYQITKKGNRLFEKSKASQLKDQKLVKEIFEG